MAKSKIKCSMCGAEDSAANPVVEILPGLNMCSNCVSFINDRSNAEISQRKGKTGKADKPVTGLSFWDFRKYRCSRHSFWKYTYNL